MMTTLRIDPVNAGLDFDEFFSASRLEAVFLEKYSRSLSRGVDRLNGPLFKSKNYKEQFRVASEKCINGTYRFSPYLEVLKPKGRGKLPRMISVPTVRDRVVLYQLNKYIAETFQASGVKGCFARQHISDIVGSLKGERDINDIYIFRTDIKVFYDSILWGKLLFVISGRIRCRRAISLISHALMTPTVPMGCKRAEYKNCKVEKGVPQGLAISNILASIYMKSVDDEMKGLGVEYYRYVDDVFMFGRREKVERAKKKFVELLSDLGLELHDEGSEKSVFQKATESFEYLGYSFLLPKLISVRESSKNGFLSSLAKKFSDHLRNKDRRLKDCSYLDRERLKDIFLLELNDQITGALSKRRCYGWIAYFYKINDMGVLYDIDCAISKMFSRLPDFGRKPPPGLKRVRRAYFEMRYNPQGGYIRDYDKIKTCAEKFKFLKERGLIDPREDVTDEVVSSRFDAYVKRSLLHMSRNEGGAYGSERYNW